LAPLASDGLQVPQHLLAMGNVTSAQPRRGPAQAQRGAVGTRRPLFESDHHDGQRTRKA